MAQSLHRVRELIGADLDDQVKEVTREFEIQSDAVAQGPHLDGRRLRGIPAISREAGGVVTDSFVPGCDEHLEEMDAA